MNNYLWEDSLAVTGSLPFQSGIHSTIACVLLLLFHTSSQTKHVGWNFWLIVCWTVESEIKDNSWNVLVAWCKLKVHVPFSSIVSTSIYSTRKYILPFFRITCWLIVLLSDVLLFRRPHTERPENDVLCFLIFNCDKTLIAYGKLLWTILTSLILCAIQQWVFLMMSPKVTAAAVVYPVTESKNGISIKHIHKHRCHYF